MFKLPEFPPRLPWEPKVTSTGVLNELIGDEMTAISHYAEYARLFRARGDLKTAQLLEHIGEEEEHHRDELMKRLGELPYE